MTLRVLPAGLLMVLLLASCAVRSGPEAAPPAVSAAQAITSPSPPVPPSVTPASPPATPHPFASLSEWDVVIIGDSTLWGVGEPYARLLEQDRGVKVNLRDEWQGGLSAADLLKALRGDFEHSVKREKWQQLIRDAEVLVLFGNPTESLESDITALAWACVTLADPGQVTIPTDAFAQYKADLLAIFDEVARLRDGRPLVFRPVGIYNPAVSVWRERGYAGVCAPFWQGQNDAVREATEERGIPFVDTHTAFNGPDHSEDPRAKGYIGADGEHPSEAGARFYAELLLKSGYDTWSARAR